MQGSFSKNRRPTPAGNMVGKDVVTDPALGKGALPGIMVSQDLVERVLLRYPEVSLVVGCPQDISAI